VKVKHEESRKKEREKKKMWKKIKKHISFYVKESEIKNVFFFLTS
jgi:flagellar basal body-associated protein FliL